MRAVRIGWSLLLAAVCASCPAVAATLQGHVTDRADDQPLGYAVILLRGPDLNRSVLADTQGRYEVPNLAPGLYRIRVSYIGYRPLEDEIEVLAVPVVTYDARLDVEAIRMDEILVAGDRDSREQTVQPSFVKLDAEQLDAIPTIGEPDPVRALQLLPGVQAASDISSGLYIRGGGPDQNLILLDGVPIYNPTHAFGLFSTFNPDALDQVTLYKGAYPAEYGGRLGAVLDVRTRGGPSDHVRGQGGVSTIAGRLMLEGPLGQGGWTLSGRRTYLDPLLALLRREDRQVPWYYFYDVGGKIVLPRGADRLEASTYVSRDDLRVDADDDTQISLRWGNTLATGSYSHLFGESFLTKLSLWSSVYETTTDVTVLSTPVYSRNSIHDVSAELQLAWNLPPHHRLSSGASVSRYRFRFEQVFNRETTLDFSVRPADVSVFVEDEWTPAAGTAMRAGLRGRYLSDGSRSFLEPRLAVSQDFGDRFRMKAAGGLYRQYLQLVTTEGFSAVDFYLPIDETAPPSQSIQGVVGAEWSPSTEMKWSLEVYYTDLSHLVLFDNEAPADQNSLRAVDIFDTGGEGFATGMEIFLQRRIGALTGWLGYTLGWTRRRFPAVNGGESFPPKYDRRHDLNLVSSYRRGPWEFSTNFVFGSGQAFTPASARYGVRNPATGSFPEHGDVLAAERNSARLLPYNRLDLSARRSTTLLGRPVEFFLDVYNVYSHRNDWFVQYDPGDEEEPVQVVKQLPVIPSLGVDFEF
jgi:hypothetical protein